MGRLHRIFLGAILTISLITGFYEASAQDAIRTIKGKVMGQAKNQVVPLQDAVIATLNGSSTASSSGDGSFEIQISDTITRLLCFYAGYVTDTVSIKRDQLQVKFILQQDKQLDEVTVRGKVKATEISTMDVRKTERIGAKELMKAACCNLSESFETTPSVDVAFTDAISGYKQIQMLGLAGPYTVITRENIPEVRGLAAVTGLTFTPGTWIEGMQLSKGTGSVVNGYESVAGQINVELVKPFEEDKAIFNFYQNTQGRSEGNIVYNHKFNDALSGNIMLHGKSQWLKTDQNGDRYLDQPNGTQLIGLNRWYYFSDKGYEVQGGVKGTYIDNVGGAWDFSAKEGSGPGKPWGFEQQIQRAEAWAKIAKMWTDKQWKSIGLQLSALTHEQRSRYGLRVYNADEKSVYANLIYQTRISNDNNTIKAGASFMYDRYDELFELNTYQRTEVVPGVFAEYAFNHKEKVNVVAGVRGDYHSIFGAFVTPRLHLRYAPHRNIAIRASAGRAQRTANIFTENMGQMASNRQFIIVNPNGNAAYGLNPEVAWNFGLNFLQKFKLNYRDGSFTTDYYYTRFQNQIVTDIEDFSYIRFYNLQGKSFAHSFQAQLDYEPVRNFDVRLAYRWYDVKMTYSGELKERPLVAKHRAFVNAGYETRNNWKFDLTVQWISPKRVPSVYAGHTSHDSYSEGYWQVSAQVNKSYFNQKLEIYLGGENLTNYMQHHLILGAGNPYAQGFDASLVWGPAMGRNIYAGFKYKL